MPWGTLMRQIRVLWSALLMVLLLGNSTVASTSVGVHDLVRIQATVSGQKYCSSDVLRLRFVLRLRIKNVSSSHLAIREIGILGTAYVAKTHSQLREGRFETGRMPETLGMGRPGIWRTVNREIGSGASIEFHPKNLWVPAIDKQGRPAYLPAGRHFLQVVVALEIVDSTHHLINMTVWSQPAVFSLHADDNHLSQCQ